ncbi:hypothetical protein EDM80_15035 [bacterium]|nr:MAG: hypothetical protein EDM80_15035 [bacterium]RIK65638.1 MAG: hypothetical protein DCC64_00550 [Planctomycetota bacterium]
MAKRPKSDEASQSKPAPEATVAAEIVQEVKEEAKAVAKTATKAARLAAAKVGEMAQKANKKASEGGEWLTQKLAEELRYAADWLSDKDKRVSPGELLQKAAKKLIKKLRKKHNRGKEFGPKKAK